MLAPRASPSASTLALPSNFPFPSTPSGPFSPGVIAILVLCGVAATLVVGVFLYCCQRVGRRREGMRPAPGTQRSVLADGALPRPLVLSATC
jgi:hypothetical protein